MNTQIALLRGINVSGQKKILMADLRLLFQNLGFKNVKTYIQSGNVVFHAEDQKKLSTKISEAIKTEYGWDIPVLVKTKDELQALFQQSPFSGEKLEKSYFTLLSKIPKSENIETFKTLSYPDEEFQFTKNCIYIYYKNGAGRAKMTTNLIERKLSVKATARNYRTLKKLIALSSEV